MTDCHLAVDTVGWASDEMVGARGLDPVVPEPRIVLPEWIANALHGAA